MKIKIILIFSLGVYLLFSCETFHNIPLRNNLQHDYMLRQHTSYRIRYYQLIKVLEYSK